MENIKEKIKLLEVKYQDLSEEELKKKEANVRKDFIDPFFRILGWNVESNDYEAETYVGKSGIADVAMKINNKIVCYQEAKKFRQDCFGTQTRKKIAEPVERQVLRYCYEKNIQWAILTNFHQMRVFYVPLDLEVISIQNAKYLKDFDLIKLLTPDSYRKGTIGQLVKRIKRKDVDFKFLKILSDQRLILATSLHKKYPSMQKVEIDENVQRILDRLVITRFAEDKGFIQYEKLLRIYEDWIADENLEPLWLNLKNFWSRFDSTYNSKIFADHAVDILDIDPQILGYIIEKFYMVSFRSISPLVLGNTYEMYLGYDIEFEKGSANLVETLAAQKAGGIYYTPTFITNYIVKKVFGERIEEVLHQAISKLAEYNFRDARDIMSNLLDLTILDPACGSGNFLVSAYQFIRRCIEEYNQIAKIKFEKRIREPKLDPTLINPLIDDWNENILKNVLWGIDIDEIASEITTVSIIIASMIKNQKLPLILAENIVQGNSLIPGPKIPTASHEIPLDMRVPLDWDFFPNEKFTYLIGNPPYVCSRKEEITPKETEYFLKRYEVAAYQLDLYQVFLQLFIEVTDLKGGLIIPDSWLTNVYSKDLRNYLLEHCTIEEIVICPPDTFSNIVDTIILIFSKQLITNYDIKITKLERDQEESHFLHKIPISRFRSNPDYLFDIYISPEDQPIIQKIENNTIHLGMENKNLAARGVGAYHKRKHSENQIKNKIFHSYFKKDDSFIPNITGRHIQWFGIDWDGKSYLSYGDWLSEPRNPELFKGPRILLRKILGKTLYASYTEEEQVVEQLVYVWKPNACSVKFDPFYILGILNSELMAFYFRLKFNQMASFPHIIVDQFRKIPIKNNLNNDEMVKIADYARLLSFFNQILITTFKEIRDILVQIIKKPIKLKKWLNINEISYITERELIQGTLRELLLNTTNNHLVIKVVYEMEDILETFSIDLDFKDNQFEMSIIIIALQMYMRKYSYKKISKDLINQIFTLIEVYLKKVDESLKKKIKTEWQNSIQKLYKKFSVDKVINFGYPNLEQRIKCEKKSWWDCLPPKDIAGIIDALKVIYNQDLEKIYELTPEESERIRRFSSFF